MRHLLRVSLALGLLGVSLPVMAQQRPLTTEDPETVGAGRVLVEGGFDYGRKVTFPASGLEGNLLRLPLIGVSVGLSSIAELQIDGGFHNRLTITDRQPAPLSGMLREMTTRTSDVEDVVVATKIRVMPEGGHRPALGIRFATRLPNASNESGLGLDTTDFQTTILVAKTVQSVRIVGNAGVSFLSDPSRGDRQNDVIVYGLSFARALTGAAEVVGEVNGRWSTRPGVPPAGTESRGQARFGARYTHGLMRWDAALLMGLTTTDPGVGVAAGFTYVFNAFKVP